MGSRCRTFKLRKKFDPVWPWRRHYKYTYSSFTVVKIKNRTQNAYLAVVIVQQRGCPSIPSPLTVMIIHLIIPEWHWLENWFFFAGLMDSSVDEESAGISCMLVCSDVFLRFGWVDGMHEKHIYYILLTKFDHVCTRVLFGIKPSLCVILKLLL